MLEGNRVFKISATVSGVRLDKYLVETLSGFSRSYLQKLIQQGHILVQDNRVKPSQKLQVGDKITVFLPPPVTPLVAEPIPVTIIYEDEDILVVNKPPGLTTHPAPGYPRQTLLNALLARCPELATIDNSLRPGIVHRLDKDTSGLMIVAKNKIAQQYLIDQFKSRSVVKGYLVLVKGKLTPERGVIEAPIGRHPVHRKRMAIVPGGREARTHYQVRQYLRDYTLVEANPETGRTHQIRVHFSAIGYPVVGDSVYGIKSPYLSRQFVHAYYLKFRLPSTKQYVEFTCELPLDLRQAMELISSGLA